MEKYGDYFIKDGIFIGKFEEMYQKFDNPWHQKEAVEGSYARHATLLTIKNAGIKYIMEVGCGLGVFTDYLSENIPGLKITGMDVSKTAVVKAKEAYSHLDFIHMDLKQFSENPNRGGYDALLFAEIMWCILDDLDKIIENLSVNYAGKYVIINQTFYKGQQQYGKEYFTDLNGLVRYLPWENLVRMEIDRAEINSIETHSMYRISRK